MNITEDNKLIAEFMGYDSVTEINGGQPEWGVQNMKFNTSLNWLMPVIKKIKEKARVYIFDNTIIEPNKEYLPKGTLSVTISQWQGKTEIENTYKAVVEYINWYNKNK